LRTGNKVWVLDEEQRIRNRDLKILHTEGKLVYVYEGLNAGDAICLSTIPNVIAGTKVKVNSTIKTSSLVTSTSNPVAALDTTASQL
jgi:hypothetical protein